jgi:hypothetical protein
MTATPNRANKAAPDGKKDWIRMMTPGLEAAGRGANKLISRIYRSQSQVKNDRDREVRKPNMHVKGSRVRESCAKPCDHIHRPTFGAQLRLR